MILRQKSENISFDLIKHWHLVLKSLINLFVVVFIIMLCKNTWLSYNFEFYADWIDTQSVLEYGVEAIGPDF